MIRKLGEYTLDVRHGETHITHPDKHGKAVVWGNGHEIETFYSQPEWSEEEELAFSYRGQTYYLSEFMRIDRHAPAWMREYDGYHGDSFFSGILVRFCGDADYVQAYTYCG